MVVPSAERTVLIISTLHAHEALAWTGLLAGWADPIGILSLEGADTLLLLPSHQPAQPSGPPPHPPAARLRVQRHVPPRHEAGLLATTPGAYKQAMYIGHRPEWTNAALD